MDAGRREACGDRTACGGRLLTLPAGAPPAPRRAAGARAIGFLRPWAFGAVSAAYLFGAGWWKWKNRAAIVELCRHFGYNYDTREPNELPVVPASSLAPSGSLLDVREMDAIDGNVSERELVTICRLVRDSEPRALFEFGTFDGRTTLNLAANSPPEARVSTLDLPRQGIAASASPIHAHEVRYADKSRSGARFANSDMSHKINQLHGDSGTFDFAPYYDTMDFVFVDASHTYEYVINDSLHAMKMLRVGHGTILWHDYSRWDGVTCALNELRRVEPGFSELRRIAGTTLGYLKR